MSSKREILEAAGQWLRRAREQHGFNTGAAFAAHLGVDPSLISRYERGVSEVSDDRAKQIAEALDMDLIQVRRNLGMWVPETESSDRPDPRARKLIGELEDLVERARQLFPEDPPGEGREDDRDTG